MSSALDDVTSALVDLFTAALASGLVPVYDGPPLSDAPEPEYVTVGDDGDPESDATSTYEQEWANLAATSRYEVGEIPCCVVAQSGDPDAEVVRDRAAELVAACQTALLADLSLGDRVMSAQLTSGRAMPLQNERGVAWLAPFTITYRAQV